MIRLETKKYNTILTEKLPKYLLCLQTNLINTDFSRKKGPVDFLNEIKKGEMTIEQAKASQEDFNNYLKTIRRGNKTKEQGNTLANINRLFNGRNDAIKFIEEQEQV